MVGEGWLGEGLAVLVSCEMAVWVGTYKSASLGGDAWKGCGELRNEVWT